MKKFVTGLILGLMCWAGAAVSHAETKYALCVGINEYSSPGNDLEGCVNDASYFYTNLVERGGWQTANMTKLLNSAAKKNAIRKAISNYAAKAVSGDTFIYQHSSHGGQNNGRSVFLCTYDINNYYEDTELATDLRSFAKGVTVIVVVDACHSGGLFMGDSGKARKAAAEFDLAGRVTELMNADRAMRKARGENVEKSLSASEIGWVTAANYTESSLDGGLYQSGEWLTNSAFGEEYWNNKTGWYDYPDSFVLGGVFLGSFTWSWWNGTGDTKKGYGDNDGYADAYECWKDAYDFCSQYGTFKSAANSSYSKSENFTPQCTNITVLRSVELGWAGKEEPSGFRFAKLDALDATVGSPVSCTLSATNTDGSAVSVSYAVSSATAPAATYSIAGNVFTFTPAADGSFSFSFTATDALTGNTAKGTLTVDATLAAPTGLANSGVTATSFTANWGTVVGAASYLLDVATDASFDRGGGGVLVEEGFGDGTKLAEGWAVESGALGGIYDSNGNYGNASPSLKLSSTVTLSTPTLSHPLDISFWYKGNGSSFTSTLAVEQLVGGSWTAVSEAEISGKAATYSHALNPAATQVRFVFTKNSGNVALDDVKITGAAGDSTLVVDGESVSGTAYTAEALDTDTYYWRVRAVGNAQGPYSATEEVKLVADPNAPPSIRAIDDIEIEVGETATASVKVSAPVENPVTSLSITAGDAAAKLGEDGVFSFAPEAVGVYPFTITAVNAKGSAEASFTVTATLAEPETPEVPAVVGSDAFTAEWKAIPGAESYELVVIEGKSGSSGGGGEGGVLTETFAKATFSTAGGSYANQTISDGDLGTWTATQCRGDQGGVPTVGGTGTLTSPEIEGGVSAVEFDYDWPFDEKNATGDIDLYVGGSKVSSASVTGGTSGTAAYSFSPISGATSIEFANTYATAKKLRISFNEIRITTASRKSIARAVGDVVYSNNVGNVTRFEVTGLQPSTEYTFSFRAIAGDETTDWSEPVSVTTSEGPSAPVWTAIPAQNTYAGATYQLDLSAYLSGSPTPTVTADIGTVTGLHYVYEPEATGSVTVTLTASNDSGTQETTFVLSVAEPPVGGNHYAVVVGCNKYDTEYVDSYNWLNGCVPDANHVQELITSRGEWEAANVTKLTDSAAKHSAVLSAIAAAADKAVPGDTFLYFHSSHGGNYTYTFVTNTALYTDWPIMVYSVDPEGTDNCICTYDSDFTAAELASALADFDPAVNIVVMIDACHSAGMFQYDGTPVSQRVVRRNAAGKAMRSADASVFAKAVSAQIGAIRRARGIRAASNVAFVTAANFDEYSWDSQSGDGGEFTTAFVEGVTNGVCDGAEYGDQDGWATFYEGWNYAKDIATGMAVGTVVDNEGHKVDANGYALYDNSDYTGAPYYEPAYYYDYYFTHAQIDNEPLLRAVRVGYAGNPTLAAPVAAPASGVTDSSFTASWSAVADASAYRLQVATDESFSTGSVSDTLVAGDLKATSSIYTEFSGVGKASGAVYAGKTAKDSSGAIQLNAKTANGAGIWTTASGGNVSRVSVEWNDGTSGTRSLEIYGSDTALTSYSAVKAATLVGTITYGSTTSLDITEPYAHVGILANGGAVYLDYVTIDWVTAGSKSSIVFDQNVGNVTGFEVTDLEAETDYYYRVQALGDPVDSDFSNVISLTTESGTPYAPVWSEILEQSAVVGQEFTFDAADYVKASPAATIELAETTADEADYLFENGYLIFTPSAEGSFTFSLNAKNDLGEAPATLTVAVAGAPVTVPELTLSNPTATTFDADWTACTGATSYQFQVATDDQFTPASAGGAFTLVTSVDGLVAGEYVILADGTDCAMDGTCSGASSGYLSCEDVAVSGSTVDTEEASIIWTLAGDASSCTLFNAAAGKYVNPATTKSIGWADTASGSWTLSVSEGVVTVANSANPSWKLQYNSGSPRFTTYDSNQKKLRFFRRDSRSAKDGGSLVLDETMSELGCTVQNLEPETTYYARVRMADGEWSVVKSISTEADVPSAPAWSDIPPQTVAVQEDLVVDLTAYVSGSPKPTITADAGTVENGVLTVSYEEAGDYTIALTAENSEGSESATLKVTVTAAPVTVPELALSNPQANSFDASWTACTGATSYQLQVATDDQFTAGGSGEATELFNNTAQTLDAPEGWTYAIDSASGKYLHLVSPENSIVSEAVSTKGYSTLSLDFRMRTYGGAAAPTALVEYSADGGDWTKLGTATAEANSLKPVSVDATACVGLASVKFRWTCPDSTGSVGVGVDKLVLSASGAGEGGSLVLDETLEDLVFAVTGLEPETTYYARVRMADGEWSAVESIKTQADVPSAPEWKEIPEQTAIVGQEFVLDLSGYVTGSPFPTITVDGAVAEGGSWSFTPDVATTYTFELVASNSEGSDSTTLTVVAEEAPPAKYALCVGLNEYDYAAWAAQGWGIDKLKGCVNDATYMKKNLTERGGWAEADVTLLTDATATKEALRGAIAAVAAKAKAGDTFVYQHSSHGLNNKDLESDEYTKNVALATYAAPYEDFELAEDLEAFADGVKVVIAIDACHSSGMFKKGAAKAGSFDIAARVSALMDANRTARKARGEDVSRNLTSDQVGWVTAADFDESSKDGGYYDTDEWLLDEDAEGEESGGTFLSSFTWGWWSGKADVSGEGDGDGWFDAYEGWSFATPVCADYDHTPQFLNPDVLRSVKLGWVGDTAPSAAIVFDPVPGVSVAIGEEATLAVVAKNADGTTDDITLSIVATDPEGLEYAFADGTLTFTPEEDGIFLFTVRALSGRASATKILGVSAALPAPVALDATDITESGFTANWTGVEGAASYQLQVSTSDSFPMVEPDELIDEGFDGVTNKASLPEDWTFEGGTFGVYTGKGYYGEAAPAIKISSNGTNILASPTFKVDRAMNGLAFWTLCNSTNPTSTVTVELLVGDEWTQLDSFVPSPDGETKEYENFDPSATQVRFVVVKASGNIAIDDVKVVQAKGDMVIDESEIDGDATSYKVEKLQPGTTYYYRVRAIGNSKSAWSETIEVTTTGEVAIPVPELTVGTSETNPDTAIYAIWLCDGVSKVQLQVAKDAEFGDESLVYDEELSDLVGVVTGLTPETTYYVRARALVGERAGEWSNVESVTTAAGGGEEPEEPAIGGEDSDVALDGFGSKKFTGKVSDELVAAFSGAVLEYATEVVDHDWNWSEDKVVENGAEWPNLDFDYESLGLDRAVFRLRFVE